MSVGVARAPERTKPAASGFLPEIQALRALAVLLVVIYHLWPGRISGGFVGVDVFFVISGFLITTHLLGSVLREGRVAFGRFWANRIWRLLPASMLVLAVCWVFSLVATPVSTASNALKQVGAASAYVVNWILAADSVDYLARDNKPTVVQHYWSLSVEEQFYVLWPLLLWAVVALGTAIIGGRGRSVTPRRRSGWLLLAVGLLVAVSLAYSIVETHALPARAYFDTFTRAWEFAAGGLLALLIARHGVFIAAFRDRVAVSVLALPQLVGLALIVVAGLVFDAKTPFPSGWAALPVAGTLLIIAGGMPTSRVLGAVIRWRPVQFFGDVSYSLYLWHWPLIIGFTIVTGRPHTLLEGIGLLIAATALAWLSKKLVEDPVRRFGRGLPRVWPAFAFAALAAAVLITASTVVVTHRAQAAAAAAAEREQSVLDASGCVGANATLGTTACDSPFTLTPGTNPVPPQADLDPQWCLTWFDEDWKTCEFGDTSGKNGTVAIVGDSHAAALTNPLGEYLQTRGMKLETFTRFGCPGLSPTAIGLRAQTPETEQACADWSARVVDELTQRSDIGMVIFTSYESAYAEPEEPGAAQLTTQEIVDTLGAVADSGKQVVLMHDFAATGGRNVPECVAGSKDPAADCSVTREAAYPPGPFDQAVVQLGDRIRVVNPAAATCVGSRCYGLVGDVVVYADDNHVSETFARSLMRYLGPALIDGTAVDAERASVN